MRKNTALLPLVIGAFALSVGACAAKPDPATCTKVGEKYFELVKDDVPDPSIAEGEKGHYTDDCKGGTYTKAQAECALKAGDEAAFKKCLESK
jgi:hypothetical protein